MEAQMEYLPIRIEERNELVYAVRRVEEIMVKVLGVAAG